MIHVVARSAEFERLFLARNPSLSKDDVTFHHDQRSYFQVLDAVINDETSDAACVVHDDVYLPLEFKWSLQELADQLNDAWPNWGVCGNAGIAAFDVGYDSSSLVRYISDPHGGPNLQQHILPAQSVDGNMLYLNTKALRERGVKMPAFEGFQLYDLSLCFETLSAGLAVLVAPHLACYHDSVGSQSQFDLAATSESYRDYLSKKLANHSIRTVNGDIHCDGLGPMDIQAKALSSAADGRQQSSVAIVVRSQFRNPELLKRALLSANAFIAAASTAHCEFRCYVITDRAESVPSEVHALAEIIAVPASEGDTRFHLLSAASKRVQEDYLWFLDDDDWLFPNEAERLSLTIASAPKDAIFFLDSMHFTEGASDGRSAYTRGSPSRMFHADRFALGLGGSNHIPICGMVLPRNKVAGLPQKLVDGVVFYEDFATQLFCLMDTSVVPITVSRLFAGISVRPSGNTITATDRTKWNMSGAELAYHVSNAKLSPAFLAIKPHSHRVETVVVDALAQLPRVERAAVLAVRAVKGVGRSVIDVRSLGHRSATVLKLVGEGKVREIARVLAVKGS